jgi:uncharacterized protein YcbX
MTGGVPVAVWRSQFFAAAAGQELNVILSEAKDLNVKFNRVPGFGS